jgi:hypothetical protein
VDFSISPRSKVIVAFDDLARGSDKDLAFPMGIPLQNAPFTLLPHSFSLLRHCRNATPPPFFGKSKKISDANDTLKIPVTELYKVLPIEEVPY